MLLLLLLLLLTHITTTVIDLIDFHFPSCARSAFNVNVFREIYFIGASSTAQPATLGGLGGKGWEERRGRSRHLPAIGVRA